MPLGGLVGATFDQASKLGLGVRDHLVQLLDRQPGPAVAGLISHLPELGDAKQHLRGRVDRHDLLGLRSSGALDVGDLALDVGEQLVDVPDEMGLPERLMFAPHHRQLGETDAKCGEPVHRMNAF